MEEESDNKISSFPKRFSKVTWYGFIHTVSIRLAIWKRVLKYTRFEGATVK